MKTRKPVSKKKKNSRSAWLVPGIAAALLVGAILILFLLAGVFHVQIPIFSDLFPAPAPALQDHYDSTFVGIHLSLPAGWVVQNDTEDMLLISSSQAAFDASVLPEGEAIVAIFRSQAFVDSLAASNVDVTSPKAIVEFIVNDGLNTSAGASRLGALKMRTVAGFEACSGGYSFSQGEAELLDYVTATTTQDTPALIVFITHQGASWRTNRPVFDAILSGMTFDPLK